MAKETNKSTTIILLVIAGALLFLVGSFTGQPIWKWPKQPTATEPTNTTIGLTTAQKQGVLNILAKDCVPRSSRVFGGTPNYGNIPCAVGEQCVFAMVDEVEGTYTTLFGCNEVTLGLGGKDTRISALCCKA